MTSKYRFLSVFQTTSCTGIELKSRYVKNVTTLRMDRNAADSAADCGCNSSDNIKSSMEKKYSSDFILFTLNKVYEKLRM